MKYVDMIHINQNFQSSINLELDLNKSEKVEEYIPTPDICDVLKKYFKTFLNYNQNRSTILEGPYGKGKSFLLLILSYLSGKKDKDRTYYNLLEKIKNVDEDLYLLIKKFDEKDSCFLPIIINSTYDNLNQSFLLGLNDSLTRAGLTDIVPDTAYSICLDMIDKWGNDKSFMERIQKECLSKSKNFNLNKIRKGLKEFDQESYRQFESLYNCVSMGLDFNPLVNNDVVKIYSDITHKLKLYGYTGIFVIFDEFSKFLEASDEDLTKHLKLIQDFAESANRSNKDAQIEFCCVTHKSLELYSNKKIDNALKTVIGRFKEIRFNRSISENYQLISSAIIKTDEINLKHRFDAMSEFYQKLSKLEMFKDLKDFNKISYGCYPLNPVTVYALIHLSEFVAQNERTLFTFISDTDENSFNSFIQNKTSGLFDVDKIYDYFSDTLKKEEQNSIRSYWYRTEAILAHSTDITERKIIKTLSIYLMVNEPEICPTDEMMISLGLNLDLNPVRQAVNKLIDEHCLRRDQITQQLSFASLNSKEIDDKIELISKTKLRNISYSEALEEIDETKYALPRRYNANYTITRFYRIAYLEEDQFIKLNSFKILKDRMFADGIIINLIREHLSEKEIQQHIDEIGDRTVIVRYPRKNVDSYFKDLVLRYAALKEILRKGENDEIVRNELTLLKDETGEDIQGLIDKYYELESNFYALNKMPVMDNVHDLLSSIFEEIYCKTIPFNNELVNKNTLSTNYQKAVNHIDDWLLNNKLDEIDDLYSETSPERTVYSSIVEEIDHDPIAQNVVVKIQEKIKTSEENRILFSDVYSDLLNAPYGLRKGVIQILLCYAIGGLSNNVTLFLHKREIDLNAANIAKAVNSDSNYYVEFAKGSRSQNDFIFHLLTELNITSQNNFRQDLKNLCNGLRRFFVGLPLIIRSQNNTAITLPSGIKEYCNCFMGFDINPTETVIQKPLILFGSYDRAENELSGFIRNWRSYLNDYEEKIIINTRKIFNINHQTSLKMGMDEFIRKIAKQGTPILNESDHIIFDTLNNLSFNDIDSIDAISKATLGLYIEDWDSDRKEELFSKLELFIGNAQKSDKINTNDKPLNEVLKQIKSIEETASGKNLKNGIESLFEDFGESVSNKEKVAILAGFIEKLL